QVQTPSSQNTAPVQPLVIQSESQALVFEPVVAPVGALMPNLKLFIPYPLRRDNKKHRNQANEQIEKFYEIFKDMSFEISFTDALTLMPKFASTLKALIVNKEKLNEMARTPMNEHCSAVILNKFPRKLGDLGKFLIPSLSLPELNPTCMTLELADRSISKPIGIAKDVSFKVGVFQFPVDFVFVDFKPDPRVLLILRRCFLKTGRALIDVHKGELTLRIKKEAITYNLDQTVRYSANYDQMTANKIDVIYEIYSQEVLGFSDVIASGNPTPDDDPIVSTTSPTLTPFGDSDFLLFEEADAFLGLEDDPDSPKINPFYYDPEGGILLLKTILNTKTVKSSVDEPPEVELKDLPPHLEYVFLEGSNKLPVIIAKKLGNKEKSALIKGINPEFCTHKILLEEDYKPVVQHQRRVNPKIHDVIKKEVSPVHCVPKKGGFTIVENEENELIPTRLVTGWREKTMFTCPYNTFAYRRMPFGLCNPPCTFQRYKMLQRCEDTNLCLNWEKSHFMVKEGIVLGHKISKNRIEVDKAKVDVIAKLPHPTTVKECIWIIPPLSISLPKRMPRRDCSGGFYSSKNLISKFLT
nr:DNA-directed DNA polymerase [Tanacetum cinerariifolium]